MREYGTTGLPVVLVHGGPGAPGYLAPLARALADAFRVVEPFQRRAGGRPLDVATHVADLDAQIARAFPGESPRVVGHSWGALLALAHATAHPGRVASLALVGCATFDPAARARLERELEARTTPALRARLDALASEHEDPDERLRAFGEAVLPLYSHDLVDRARLEAERGDARGHRETWDDALRLQAEGRHPAAFAAIRAPARMIHGDRDPHPFEPVHAALAARLPGLELRVLADCGHYPWLERAAREPFLADLRAWLARPAPPPA